MWILGFEHSSSGSAASRFTPEPSQQPSSAFVIPAPSISRTPLDPSVSGAYFRVLLPQCWKARRKKAVSQGLNKKIALGGKQEIPLLKTWDSELFGTIGKNRLPTHSPPAQTTSLAILVPMWLLLLQSGLQMALAEHLHQNRLPLDADTNTTELPCRRGAPSPAGEADTSLSTDLIRTVDRDSEAGVGRRWGRAVQRSGNCLCYPSPPQTLSYSSPASCLPSGGVQTLEACQIRVLQ